MKKAIITLFAALGFSALASAQDGLAIGFGYRGFVLPYAVIHSTDSPVEGKRIPQNGIYIGLDYTAEDVLGPLDLGFGLNFDRLWYFYNNELGVNCASRSLDMQIPLYLGWAPDDMDDFTPFIFAGATFELGLTLRNGDWLSRSSYNTIDLYKEEAIGYVLPQYRRVDCLVGGGLGFIVMGGLRIHASCYYGCVNRIKDYPGGYPYTKVNNLQVSAGISYRFH